MSWSAFHRREAVLRTVVEVANQRRDGALPTDVPGVAETFADDAELVAALQLRWHTRLAGRIERALSEDPFALENAVLNAWRRTASELAGVRAVLDSCTDRSTDAQLTEALERANRKEWVLMAVMAGRASVQDGAAAEVGRRLEQQARAGFDPSDSLASTTTATTHRTPRERGRLLDRLLAHLAA